MATVPRSDREREEIARRGDEIYGTRVRPHLGSEDEGKFVLIDIKSGNYELDRDEVAASDRLLARHPDAHVWMVQVGSRYARRHAERSGRERPKNIVAELAGALNGADIGDPKNEYTEYLLKKYAR